MMNKSSVIKFIDLEQGSREWLEFRKGKIGSSMAASIVGKGFKTPLQLFEDIMEDRETKVNDAMRRGNALEPIARAWINDKYKSDLQPAVIQNNVYDWHISSLDGLWVQPDGSIFVCEIKCPGFKDHQCALDGNVPEKYLPQLYHILFDLPNVDKILYLSYSENSVAEIWVHRDESELDKQFKEEQIFYKRLLDCNPPEAIEKDWIELEYPEAQLMAFNYIEIMKKIESLERDAKNIRDMLIADLGTIHRAKIADLKIQKVIRKGAIDYSKIKALERMNLEPYRKAPVASWRLTT